MLRKCRKQIKQRMVSIDKAGIWKKNREDE